MRIQIDTAQPLTTLDQDILALVLDQETVAEQTILPETAVEPEPETAVEPEPEPEPAPTPRRRGRPALKAVEEQQSPDDVQAETRDLVTSMLRTGGAETVRDALRAVGGFTKFSEVPVEAMAALRAALLSAS